MNGRRVVDTVRIADGDEIELGPFPPWCRAGATEPFTLQLVIEGLDAQHRVPSAGETSRLLPARREPSRLEVPPASPTRPGSVILTPNDVFRLAGLKRVAGDLRLDGLEGPVVLQADALTRVDGDLRITDCAGVRRISCPALEFVGGQLVFDGLPDLEELAMPSLVRAHSVTVRSTSWLTNVAWPELAEVKQDVTLAENRLLYYVALPKLERARRVQMRFNQVLPATVVEDLRVDFRQRRSDAVVHAVHNGHTEFATAVRRRLQGFGLPAVPSPSEGAFERFVRIAPELIEVHERMLREADRDGDRNAIIERLRRLLALARAQNDEREVEYDRALQYLVEPEASSSDLVWLARLEDATHEGPIESDAARLWLAELSANWERAHPSEAIDLVGKWRIRGARTLMAQRLAQCGLHGLAARTATRSADASLAFWLWEAVLDLGAHQWRPEALDSVETAAHCLGRLLSADNVREAGRAFIQLAESSINLERPAQPRDIARGGRVSPAARAAASWLTEDILDAGSSRLPALRRDVIAP